MVSICFSTDSASSVRLAPCNLDQVAARLRARSLQVQTRVTVEQQPAVAILHETASSAVDLIALETHGRRGLSRLVLGSVADKVVRGTSVPVLVHRPVYAREDVPWTWA